MEDVQGKIAFVTGGASGIGLSMAKAFLKAGMKVAIADIRQDRLTKAESVLNGGDNVLLVELDVTDRAAIERAADKTESSFGKVHVVCNNAGIGEGGPIHEVSPDIWRRVMNINLDAVFNGIQVFVPRIKKHGEGGHIVNTSSMTGMTAIPNTGPYSATKAAVAVMSEISHQELAPDNIGVSVLAPWIVYTPIFHYDVADDDAEGIEKRKKAMAKRFGDSLTEPDTVGEMVLNGILNNELYIFNDPVSRKMFEKKMDGIYGAIARQFPGK
ncbi:MAG: SDR family NAD(P)-dependent oxidoreductase [Proteobacteria bacterium]|nr:SDR family NAD(P)-dependent oxidoreductase [Pseudomonadota bacterium]